MASALSVSRKELFSEVWVNVINENSFKLKPKVEAEDKTTYIMSITRPNLGISQSITRYFE